MWSSHLAPMIPAPAAGEVVPPSLGDSLTRLLAEGTGEEDEGADRELRAGAVEAYLELLDRPKLPRVLLKVGGGAGWGGGHAGRPPAAVASILLLLARGAAGLVATHRLPPPPLPPRSSAGCWASMGACPPPARSR